MANTFTVKGLAPTHDPLWPSATRAQRAAYLRVCRVLVLAEWDRQVAAGLDKDGAPMARLKASTIKHRRSAMGPADPHAPPLIPAHELSRTRSLVDARVAAGDVVVYWKTDPVTGRRWGTILNYHRRGRGHLPVRDVFGLAPEGLDRVARAAHLWWAGFSRGLAASMPTRPRPGKAARPPAAEQPRYQPKAPPRPDVAARSGRFANLSIGGHVYSTTRGAADELIAAVRSGRFTGFRSYADDAGGPARPPAAAAPRPGGPRPAPPRPAAKAPPAPRPAPPPPAAAIAAAPAAPGRLTAADMARYAESQGFPLVPLSPAELKAKVGATDADIRSGPMLYDPREKTIFLNPAAELWSQPDLAAYIAGQAEGRWWAAGHPMAMVDHEIGHARHHRALLAGYWEDRLREPFDERTAAKVAGWVSGYAATNPLEFVAEVYAALKAGREFPPQVMSFYETLGGVLP